MFALIPGLSLGLWRQSFVKLSPYGLQKHRNTVSSRHQSIKHASEACCKVNAFLCGVFFNFGHKSPCCVKTAGRAEAEEGGAEAVVQSQTTADAKVAGMEEVGGREGTSEKNLLLSLIACMD